MLRSWMIAGVALLLTASGFGQAWMTAYENGLRAARDSRWPEAREAFKLAATTRPADQSGPTSLPGPVTEQRRWRDGAPYSPNFLAAYSLYRQGLATQSADEQTAHLRTAAGELEGLLAGGQYSRATFYFLRDIYTRLGDTAARQKVDTLYQEVAAKATFRVDLAGVTPEDQALITQTFEGGSSENPIIRPGVDPGPIIRPNSDPGSGTLVAPTLGAVPIVGTKYALLIGNSESQIAGSSVPFAADGTAVLREALTTGAGYAEQNITVLTNATAEQMQQAAAALAEKVSEGGTVFIYFGGVGAHLDGRDFLAGVNTSAITDSSTMLAKADLFTPFIRKGAQVFAFFEVNRPITSGTAFGMEVPMLGAVSQVYGTLRGFSVFGMPREGKQIGFFADAMAKTIGELRSNRLPITEFAWQLFYKMHRSSGQGGSGRQTPTLPIRTNMASDARF